MLTRPRHVHYAGMASSYDDLKDRDYLPMSNGFSWVDAQQKFAEPAKQTTAWAPQVARMRGRGWFI